MPQLDISTFVPQLFWLAVTFIVLYILMTTLGLPRVRKAIEGRRHRLDSDLSRAAQLKAEAEGVLSEYQRTLASARADAQAALRETGARLAAEAAERQHALAATLADEIAAAERRIAATKDEALAEVRGIAVEVGGAVVEKLTGAPADPARLSAAVETVAASR
ncbi:MAG TPA: F0F1 ATP synthase subunit B' [Stellaceae bacterium]|nr:F0F1 ATP synthase subunit B' [Stellaceae bacterium]